MRQFVLMESVNGRTGMFKAGSLRECIASGLEWLDAADLGGSAMDVVAAPPFLPVTLTTADVPVAMRVDECIVIDAIEKVLSLDDDDDDADDEDATDLYRGM